MTKTENPFETTAPQRDKRSECIEKMRSELEEKDKQIEKLKLKVKRLKGRLDLTKLMLSDVRLLVQMLKDHKGLV